MFGPALEIFLLVAGLGESPATNKIDPLLDDLSRRAFRYFWEQSNSRTGFTLDRANNTKDRPRKSHVASVAATGFGLAATAIGVERGWVERSRALQRARSTLEALETKPVRKNGWFYHFFDWETGERVWNCEVSSIDTAILLAGMFLAERSFRDQEVSDRARRILEAVDWRWMLTDGGKKPDSLLFSHGWRPESGFLVHRWNSYSEHMLLYVQGYGAWAGMPKTSWPAWKRPRVSYQGIDLLVGGPLFLHQMSHVFLDFENRRDPLGYDYFVASRRATQANRRYCLDNSKGFAGDSGHLWGLSACDGPDGYDAFGAPGWVRDNGTLAPAAAVASLIFTPKESLEAARAFADQKILGRYGFPSGYHPARKWQSPDVIGIDLGQLLLAIECHRDGLPHRRSLEHPVNARGLKQIGFRRTEEGKGSERALVKRP